MRQAGKRGNRIAHQVMEEHDCPDPQHTQKTMVLLPVVQHRFLLRHGKADRKRRRNLAAVMYSLSAGIEHHLPSGVARSPAPIHVVPIHEQVFVKQAYGIHRFAANHRKAPNDHIYWKRPVMRKIEHVLAGEEPRILKTRGQTARRTKVVPQSWESPASAL